MKKFSLLIGLLVTVITVNIQALPEYNDLTLSPFLSYQQPAQNNPFLFFTHIKSAHNEKGYTDKGKKVAAPQYLDATQNGLAMLKGAPQGSQAAALAALFVGADDGTRGHYVVDADYKREVTVYLGGSYALSDKWWIGAFIPFISSSLKNFVWLPLTQEVTPEDMAFYDNLGDDFLNQVEQLSDGLSLEGWEKRGSGDLSLWLGWHSTFVQHKEWIKSVTPHIRAGLSLPTGIKKDENKVFFLPYGNDGATGIQVGLGLVVNLKHYVNVGLDVEFLHLFTTTRERRIKTDVNQTEALLLTKTLVSKDPGLSQRFTLFAEFLPTSWLQARIQYSYIKESESYLYPLSNNYSTTIANTASSLQGFTSHNFVVAADIATQDYYKWLPNISLEYIHPFHGKRIIQADQISFGLSYNF